MPKDRRVRSFAFDCSRVSPYPCSSSVAKQCRCQPENPMGLGFKAADVDDVQAWEDARCPICMENPHNAVLLRCSSFANGCRPFMCNTSYRHSNCLDQFSKSPGSSLSTAMLNMTDGGSDMQPKLLCPLCRGEIFCWYVIGSAREFMNNKSRACSTETCDFKGTYNELRKHARSNHPNVRPTEVDSDRQLNWSRFVRERDYEDVLSSIQPDAEDANNEIEESLSDVEDIFPYISYLGTLVQDDMHEPTMRHRRIRYNGEAVGSSRGQSIIETDTNSLDRSNNPSPVDRFELGSTPHWMHRSTQSERVFLGRYQNSQSPGGQGIRRRTPRMSTFNNIGQILSTFNNRQ